MKQLNTIKFHAISLNEVFGTVESNREGLTHEEAISRIKTYGKNILPKAGGENIFKILWRQIKDPLIYILIFSSVLAIGLGKTVDGLVVVAVVVINTLIGFFQELQAGKAIRSLMNLVPLNATVLRNGHWETISAEDLVPGDIVRVSSGDKIPADLRLFQVKNLKLDESALTGESVPVEKNIEVYKEETVLGDRKNIAYSGTYSTYGTGMGVVILTGSDTALGRINQLIEQSTELKTPLTKSLDKVGKILTVGILIVSAILLAIGLTRGLSIPDAILTGITLAVAAIPEGLPAIVTIALAIGVKRMARKNAIIRKLPAVETLGSTTTICTDKTGTLTRNEMTIQEIFANGSKYTLSGIGYKPKGIISPAPSEQDVQKIHELLLAGVLCNDASLKFDDGWKINGDPTEAAVVVAGYKVKIIEHEVRKKYPRLDSVPFESERQFMATLHKFPNESVIFLKGAPEVVINKCRNVNVTEIADEVSAMATKGQRILAFAKKNGSFSDNISDSDLLDLEFLGLAGMIDPPREEVIGSIAQCHTAGIVVKMITGDHAKTASAIAQHLNIIKNPDQALTGIELNQLDASKLEEAVIGINVFARVAPEHKLQIVKALQNKNHVVAMTGDGVNDAPALKQADIGVAMGITGTDVSKETADMILKDDNFASIVSAVREGRRVYDNLIKSLTFVLPTNLGLAVILIISVLFFPQFQGVPLQSLLPVQALWINMITTVTLALPLAFEKAEKGIMERPPRKTSEPLLNTSVIFRTILAGLIMGAGSIGLFLYEYYLELPLKGHDTALTEAQTISVTSIVLFQVFYLIHCRSFTDSIKNLNITTNPSLLGGIILILLFQLSFIYVPTMNALFHSAPLNLDAWLKTLVVSILIYPLISIEKAIIKAVKRT